jgi:uncharacterized protein (DUF736 family)
MRAQFLAQQKSSFRPFPFVSLRLFCTFARVLEDHHRNANQGAKTMTTNILKFETEDFLTSKATGTISTLDWDLTIEAQPAERKSDKSPTHRLYGRSPAGHSIDCGAIWLKQSKSTGKEYLSLSLRGRDFNANLGQAAGQDDPTVQAVISWD